MDEADLWVSDVETSEGTCRSCHVSEIWASSVHNGTLYPLKASASGHETRLPKRREEHLMTQARWTYWRKWAAKHEYEELKEGIWLEPALTLLRRTTKEEWTDKHRHVARKLVLEGQDAERTFRHWLVK